MELGAQVIINISASPYHKNRLDKRKQLLVKEYQKLKYHLCTVIWLVLG